MPPTVIKDAADATAIIEAARRRPWEDRRVYKDTPEFHVLLRYNPIPAGAFRYLHPRLLWTLLTEFTFPTDEEGSK